MLVLLANHLQQDLLAPSSSNCPGKIITTEAEDDPQKWVILT